MALTGGVLAASLGGDFSLSSLFASFTVLGIAVRNGVVMTSHFHRLERAGSEAFGPQLVLRGARERLAPEVMTTLTTGLALLPFALFGGVPGHEMVAPMAAVILGGLVTSTLLVLFILPTLYLRFGASREPELDFRPDGRRLTAECLT